MCNWSPQRGEGEEKIFVEIMARNFQKLMKTTSMQIQEVQ